ncbi:MAG: beta-N-acetylhexosaminidase, partial [Flavisolibacter sp.]|nr:beta-N-acetylhexosaminidase [Flavisolibacter sp.]
MYRVLLLLLFISEMAYAQNVAIIPQPVSLKVNPGTFALNNQTVIVTKDEEDRKAAQFLNDYLQQVYGFK